MDTLTKEIIAKTIADTVVEILDMKEIDFSKCINSEGAAIAREIHNVLNKYGYDEGNTFDESTDFKVIEEIVSIYEKHGY
ncbi:MAG: hypothetical protein UIM24_06245 [Clostridia bacterium]|nr:hypothetical protein [Clostridia bacterium]